MNQYRYEAVPETQSSYTEYVKLCILQFLYEPKDSIQEFMEFLLEFYEELPSVIQTTLIILGLWLILKVIEYIRADYQAYLDLGEGGTPSNWWGWWRIKRLTLCGAIPDVLDPPHVDPQLQPYRGLLYNLPKREGKRPTVGGVAPQRQLDQRAHGRSFDELIQMMNEFAAKNPNHLQVETSLLDKHTLCLRAKNTQSLRANESNNTLQSKANAEFGLEICHPHRKDGSLHMILHPEDVGTVIEAGWGERHPLSRSSWYWLFWYRSIKGHRPPVPETLCFIYAPRNEAEFKIVKKILYAAAWWVSGVEFTLRED